MYNFLNFRSRLFKAFVLGLVLLTFYAYYWTTIDQVHQFAIFSNNGQYSSSEGIQTHENLRGVSPISGILKNVTLKPFGLHSNASHNPSNLSTAMTMVSMSSSSQLPSSSYISTNLKINVTLKETKIIVKNTSTIGNNLTIMTRDIYESGHSVNIAERCPYFGRDMSLVIMIMSAPKNSEARTAIRQTWGHYGQRKDISILFILGRTLNEELEKNLRHEQNMYGDIIRGNFIDSYSNLTLKTISILEWVEVYCSKVKFVLKADDDMFINVPRLLLFINNHKKDKNVIFGRLARKWKPIRNKKSKYYVSTAQYNLPMFPNFTTGPAYLLSCDIVGKLFKEALNQTYLKLEDVFMTGVVAQKLGVKRVQANEFLNRKISFTPCNVQKGISIHMVTYSEQFDLWKKLLDGKNNCKL